MAYATAAGAVRLDSEADAGVRGLATDCRSLRGVPARRLSRGLEHAIAAAGLLVVPEAGHTISPGVPDASPGALTGCFAHVQAARRRVAA